MNPLKSRRGSTVTAMPTVMIVLGVLFVVGLIVVGNLRTIAVAMDLGTQGNATRTTLFNNIYSAFDLGVIAPIIVAAVAIIGILAYFKTR